MDTVEFVRELESIFGVEIPDSDLEKMQTVGQLRDWLVRETQTEGNHDRFLSAAVFYRLRRGVDEIRGTTEPRISPATSVESVLPGKGRVWFWQQLEFRCELKLPALVRPILDLFAIISVSATIALTTCFAVYYSTGSAFGASVSGSILFFLSLAFSNLATRGRATSPHRDWADFRKLSGWILARNYRMLVSQYGNSNESDLWIVLKSVLAEHFGVRQEDIRPESNFISDILVE